MMARLLLPLLFCLLPALCAATASAPLRAGGFIVAPLVMGEPGQPVQGAVRTYLEREVVPRGVSITWMPAATLPQAIEALRDGSLDIVLLGSGTAASRSPGVAAFEWTYLYTQPHLAVLEQSPLREVRSLDQLSGLGIGWLAGAPVSPGLRRAGARWLQLPGADWQVANLARLRAGEIDAVYFENEFSPLYFSHIGGMRLRLVRLPMPPRAFFMLYSRKADPAALARFDRAARSAFAGRRFRDFLDTYARTGGTGSALARPQRADGAVPVNRSVD